MMNYTKINTINELFKKEVKRGRIPGVNYLIAKKGKIIHRAEIGFSDREAQTPMQSDHLFQVYSLAKPIATFAILKLLEEGEITLDDPIIKYLPEFSDLKVLENERLVDLDKPITIRHLLTHLSGFNYQTDKEEINLKMRAVMKKVEKADKFDAEDWVKEFSTIPITCQPGTEFSYGFATNILQIIFERIKQIPLATYLQEELFTPLGMDNTFYVIPMEKRKMLAKGYTWNPQEETLEQLPKWRYYRYFKNDKYLIGGQGLVTSIDDYFKFAQMILDGGITANKQRIIKKEIINLMKIPQIPDGNNVSFLPGANFSFGFGVFTHPERHDFPVSKGELCWAGYGHTCCWINPNDGSIILQFAQLFPFGNPLLFTEFKSMLNN